MKQMLLVGGLLALPAMFGCSSNERATAPMDGQADSPQTMVTSPRVLLDDPATLAILNAGLSLPNVTFGRSMLESEGYTYVEENSIVLIQDVYAYTGQNATPGSLAPDPGRFESRKRLTRSDTVIWLAFENPTHDSANHTAVITYIRGAQSYSALVELDISVVPPIVLRQGEFRDGEFDPRDIDAASWLGCMVSGAAASVATCSFTNCGFGHCMAIGGTATLVGCTAGWLYEKLTS